MGGQWPAVQRGYRRRTSPEVPPLLPQGVDDDSTLFSLGGSPGKNRYHGEYGKKTAETSRQGVNRGRPVPHVLLMNERHCIWTEDSLGWPGVGEQPPASAWPWATLATDADRINPLRPRSSRQRIGLCSVLRPRQHSTCYMGDGFTGQKTQPTVSKYWRKNPGKGHIPVFIHPLALAFIYRLNIWHLQASLRGVSSPVIFTEISSSSRTTTWFRFVYFLTVLKTLAYNDILLIILIIITQITVTICLSLWVWV